jgi:hypothetical protein
MSRVPKDIVNFFSIDSGDLREVKKWADRLVNISRQGDPPRVVQMIIGTNYALNDRELTGLLLHPSRLATAIFVGHEYIRNSNRSDSGYSGMLEVCVHELGHVLNLTHGHAQPAHTCAMQQATDRRGRSYKEAWREATREESTYTQDGMQCHPLSASARQFLRSAQETLVQPGIECFQDTLWPGDDVNSRPPHMCLTRI